MLLTPTYHVFDMYKQHQGATSVRVLVDTPKIVSEGDESIEVPQITGSASVRDDELFLTLTNNSISDECEVQLELLGLNIDAAKDIKIEQLTSGDARDHNTFDNPSRIRPESKVTNWNNGVVIQPPHSVTAFTIELR